MNLRKTIDTQIFVAALQNKIKSGSAETNNLVLSVLEECKNTQ